MPDSAALSPPGRFAHAGVLALTVLVFAAVIAAVTLRLRADLREQILQREADTLAAVAAMQLDNRASEMGGEAVADVPGALLVAVLKTSRLRDVLGVRVFDPQGAFKHEDGLIGPVQPARTHDWSRVRAGESVARLHPRSPNEELIFVRAGPEPRGLIEAWVPLRRSGSPALIGAAQFWLSGGSTLAELDAHDGRLWTQAAIAWLVGSVVIVVIVGWAFRRLDAANRQLRARSEDLLRANRELVLAAKTSALGAVTAHLMHELKNPLAGLEVIVGAQGEAAARGEAGGELAAASELTRRLRTMVNDVVGVLRDEQSGAEFELTCADIAEIVAQKVRAEARERGVTLEATGAADVTLAGRRANLAILVLRNLVQNAMEATPRGGTVRLKGQAAGNAGVEFTVDDTGRGLPEVVKTRIFQPCASSKPGGSGLGLALSYQLAQQAGGRLELVRSDERGTRFRLVLAGEA